MGISIYVMPLTRYLTGAFRTTWDRKVELAGGKQGFLITPEGMRPGPPERPRLVDEAVRRVLEAVDVQAAFPRDDESREAVSAVSMSYGSIGDVVVAAGRYGVDRDLGLVAALGEIFLWLPADFEGIREVSDPFDDESVVSVASVLRLARQLEALDGCLDRDPRQEELESMPEGTVLTGFLGEFSSRRGVVRTLRRLAGEAADHRLPMIVEG